MRNLSSVKTLSVKGKSLLNIMTVKGALKAGLFAGALMLGGCQGIDSVFPKQDRPIPNKLIKKIKKLGMEETSPIMLRIFKTENVMEVWKARKNGRFALLETYEICKWSGKLGPKFKEGDKQAPEGFYSVGKPQMNPNSKYHLSFNIGFPNRFDRSHDRTGRHLMVHGACSSAGCYSMTDERVEEIYSLAREAFKGGQKRFQVQAYPFRMTPENMAKNAGHKYFEFWKMLKEGSDHFEITKYPPKIDVCEKRYMFNRVADKEGAFSSRRACPKVTMPQSLITAYSERREKHQDVFSKILKRQQSRAKLTGEELSLPQSSYSLVAKGSEILPPPTPKPAPKVVPVPKPSPALVSVQPTQPVIQSTGQATAQAAAQSTGQAALSSAGIAGIGSEIPQSSRTVSVQTADPVAAPTAPVAPATTAPNTAAPAVTGQRKLVVNAQGKPLYYILPNGQRIPIPEPAPRVQ